MGRYSRFGVETQQQAPTIEARIPPRAVEPDGPTGPLVVDERLTVVRTRWFTLWFGRSDHPATRLTVDRLAVATPATPRARLVPPMPPLEYAIDEDPGVDRDVETGPPVVTVLDGFTINGHPVGGVDRPWKYTQTAELILYLAVQGPVSRETASTALWPDQPANPARLHQVVSDARTKAVGALWMPAAGRGPDGVYRLEGVDLDLDRFHAHVAQGNRREALELVGADPFRLPLDGYEWCRLHAAAGLASIRHTAHGLAADAFEAQDWGTVMWAARKAHTVDPYDAEAVVLFGRAALAAQDVAGIGWAFAVLEGLEDDEAAREGLRLLEGG